jgi:hypothetical protein
MILAASPVTAINLQNFDAHNRWKTEPHSRCERRSMKPTTCPIWGTPARELPRIGDRREIISPCAGGRYVIFGPVDAMLEHRLLDNREKTLLTDWLMSQRRDGEVGIVKLRYF